MKKTLKPTHIGILLLILLFGGCQKCKKEVCPAPTSAKFKMYQPLDYYDYNTDTKTYTPKKYIVDEDVFFMESTITFEAEDSTALSYEWKIGDDDRVFTTKKFSLRFKENDLGAVRQLDIRLIIKKSPASCNIGDNGVDTLVRKVNFNYMVGAGSWRTEPDQWAMYGKYLGFNEDEPNKKFTIEVKREKRPSYPYGEGLNYLVGLLPGCLSNGNPVYIPIGGNNTAGTFVQPENSGYFIPRADYTCESGGQFQLAYLSSDKQVITILYEFVDVSVAPAPYLRKSKKFIGTRIP